MTEWNGEHVVPALWYQEAMHSHLSLLPAPHHASASAPTPAALAPRAAAPSEPRRLEEEVHQQLAQQRQAPSMVAASHVVVHGSTRSSVGTTSSSSNISRRQQLQVQGSPVKARAPVSSSSSSSSGLHGKAYFEFLPLQTSVKPTLRPKGLPASRNNRTTSDSQATHEAAVAAARSQRFMAQAAALPAHPYHSTLLLGPEGAVAQEHVGQDRGKGRPEWCRSQAIYDPITSMSRPVTAPSRADARAGLLLPAKHSFAGADAGAGAAAVGSGDVQASGGLLFCGNYGTTTGQLTMLQRRPGSACADRGWFNPITHTWLELPSPEAQALQQKASERASGSISSRRRGSISTDSSSGAAGCLSNSRPRDSVGSLLNHGSRDAAGGVLAGAPGRQAARCGINWGTYDPLWAVWVVPPSDARCASAEVGPGGIGIDRLAFTAEGMRPVLKGEYNPITCQWVVEPTNWKAAQTLDFAPRQLFQDKAFVRR